MALRGNGPNWGSAQGAYYNPLEKNAFIVFVSAISADVVSTTATQSLPIALQNDDEIFAHVSVSAPGGNPTISAPAGEGWTDLASAFDGSMHGTKAAVFFKRWGSGSIDNAVITFTTTAGAIRLVLIVVRNANASVDPTATALSGATNVGSKTLFAPSIENPTFGRVFHFFQGGSALTPAENSLYEGAAYLGTAGIDVAGACSTDTPMTGTVPVATADSSAASTPNGWNCVSVALQGISAFPVVEEFTAISANNNSPTASNSLASTPNTGDIIIAHCFISSGGNGNVAVTPPAGEGWQTDTNTLQAHSVTGSDSKIAIFWKRWGSGFIDNTAVTFVSALTSNMRLVLLRVSGCIASGTPYSTSPAGSSDSSGDAMSIIAPAHVAPDNALAMRFFACSTAAGAMSLSPPMNAQYSYSWTSGDNGAMAFSTQVVPRARTLGARSTSTSTPTGNGWIGITATAQGVPL